MTMEATPPPTFFHTEGKNGHILEKELHSGWGKGTGCEGTLSERENL